MSDKERHVQFLPPWRTLLEQAVFVECDVERVGSELLAEWLEESLDSFAGEARPPMRPQRLKLHLAPAQVIETVVDREKPKHERGWTKGETTGGCSSRTSESTKLLRTQFSETLTLTKDGTPNM